jgi:hypothetical protein
MGFFSVVAHATRPEHVLVRGRVKSDMDNLAAKFWPDQPEISYDEIGAHDYPYRMVIRRDQWGNILANLGANVPYTNFKAAVEQQRNAARDAVYYTVWATVKRGLERVDRFIPKAIKKEPRPGRGKGPINGNG